MAADPGAGGGLFPLRPGWDCRQVGWWKYWKVGGQGRSRSEHGRVPSVSALSGPVSLGSGRDFWSGRKNGGVGWVQSTRRRLPDRWVLFSGLCPVPTWA